MLDTGNVEWGEAVVGREAICLNQWVRAFVGWGCWGATCRNRTVSSDSHLEIVIGGLTSIILVVLKYS